ncbi:hypothetical protein VQ7734_02881 [Vibrio quintilis]|uniref:Uncharacterized protein n=1 Tax=Vibrio quintilis TaxID=1117707 RepID=A0A1M7YX00_9VIBR|nr:hypothetical protein VQ7734_02881 [Vibrio quintilis]
MPERQSCGTAPVPAVIVPARSDTPEFLPAPAPAWCDPYSGDASSGTGTSGRRTALRPARPQSSAHDQFQPAFLTEQTAAVMRRRSRSPPYLQTAMHRRSVPSPGAAHHATPPAALHSVRPTPQQCAKYHDAESPPASRSGNRPDGSDYQSSESPVSHTDRCPAVVNDGTESLPATAPADRCPEYSPHRREPLLQLRQFLTVSVWSVAACPV